MRLLLANLMVACCLPAAIHYVAVDGTPEGKGTANAPWDFQTALEQPKGVTPGDTICVSGGTYVAPEQKSRYFRSRLVGEADQFITIRPCGPEKVLVDGGFEIYGPYVVLRDFEFFSSITVRVSKQSGPNPSDIVTPVGIGVFAPNVKVINTVVHDLSSGLSSWRDAHAGEFYGNIVFYNGHMGPDRAHGHGAYMQNTGLTKRLEDNIIFNQFELGMQIFGTATTRLENFHLIGNVVFNNGTMGGRYSRNLLIGGDVIVRDPVLRANVTYFPTDTNHGGDNNLGYYPQGQGCVNLDMEDNYFVSGSLALTLNKCAGAMRNNTFFGDIRNFARTDFPANSYLGLTRPTRAQVFVRPNRYESGRANITVLNWPLARTVAVDLSRAGLWEGDRFEIYDVQNLNGAPIASGNFDGKPVELPMTLTKVADPIGEVPFKPVHTTSEFNVFVLRRTPSPNRLAHGIYVEAEKCSQCWPFNLTDGADSSGGQHLTIADASDGSAEYEMRAPAGDHYRFWLRVKTELPDLAFNIAVGDQEPLTFRAYPGGDPDAWQWVELIPDSGSFVPLSQAVHRIRLRPLNAVQIDQWFYTNWWELTPPPAASNPQTNRKRVKDR